MRCPKCGCIDDKVIDSRSSRDGSTIRRRRECINCSHRFTTYEEVEHSKLMVIKRDGRREEFSREKLLSGIRRACQKRPISEQVLEQVVDRIIEDMRNQYESEVPSVDIGAKVMEELKNIDKVAYIRFASVYRGFEEVTDFVQVIQKLERKSDTATIRLPGI
ncbi:MAG: transcriptional regulator NrdR [Verrucomicrobiae bacterium]|nr:transcriptional regulator NrdR [Verrucomicrobiae bacterium]